MMQPEGFEVGGPDHCLQACKVTLWPEASRQGLEQDPSLCTLFIGFNCVQSDHGLYIYLRDDVRLLMPVFVDDITLACKDGAKIDSVIQELSQHFKLQDLGPHNSLGGLHP